MAACHQICDDVVYCPIGYRLEFADVSCTRV